ncbi:MAG: hypothetical protein COB15_08715 [Flavobacteriales bacterium]|nr:MAG: hypothetical protein COB15_08715 [Flavobacteriales bacterium]
MKNIILIINTVLLISVLAYLGFTSKKEKQAYVNVSEVYNDFEMKKELENKLITVQNRRKKVLDSLEVELQLYANNFSPDKEISLEEKKEFDFLERRFLSNRETFLKENERVTLEFKNQIFTQMNKYIEEYGAENKYDYLFGTTGQGNIMYAQTKNNVTKEVINYINEKYNGNN